MGITGTPLTSVSRVPPGVLWCIDRKSDGYDAITKDASYPVSSLGTEHQDVSSRLAKQGSHSLDGIGLLATKLGPPSLADALAVFECEAEAMHDAGDHAILIGRVLRFSRPGEGEPLVFFRGKYGSLAQAS